MPISFTCENCGKRINAPDGSAGKQGKCPKCKAVLQIPLASVAPSSASSHSTSSASAVVAAPAAEPAPLGDLLDEALATMPAASPLSAGDPLRIGTRPKPNRIEAAYNAAGAGFTSFLASHKLATAVLLLAIFVFLSWSISGRWIVGAILGAIGVAVALTGYWPMNRHAGSRRTEWFRERSLSIFWSSLGFIFVLAVVARVLRAVLWVNEPDPVARPMVGLVVGLLILVFVLTLMTIVLSGLVWAGSKLSQNFGGFFRFFGWTYISVFGILPLMALMLLPALAGRRPDGGDVAQGNLADVPSPKFPGERQFKPGRDGIKIARVELDIPPGTPGAEGNTLIVYLPPGEHQPQSLPCILIAPAGATVFTGIKLAGEDMTEHIPYVRAGCAVVAYEIDGYVPRDTQSNAVFRQGATKYRAAHAGLVNARNALDYIAAHMPEVDPQRIVTAGHSSAGHAALLAAAHDTRVDGCISYAALIDPEDFLGDAFSELDMISPGTCKFVRENSPLANVANIKCPVFLFHAADDQTVSASQSQQLHDRLKQLGRDVTLKTVSSGGHYDSMVRRGIPSGIEWLRSEKFLPSLSTPTPEIKPTPVANVVPWIATPDAAKVSASSELRAAPLHARPLDLRQIQFAADTPHALVLADLPGASGHSLQRIDMATGKASPAAQFDSRPKLLAVSRNGKYALLAIDSDVIYWSCDDNREAERWTLPDRRRPHWGSLLAEGGRALTLDGHGRFSAWNLGVAQPPPEAYGVDKVRCAAVSPGGQYVAVFFTAPASQPQGRIVDAVTGRTFGELAMPAANATSSPLWQAAEFDREGTKLAAAGAQQIVVWSMVDGVPQATINNSSGGLPLAFIDEQHLLSNRTIVPIANASHRINVQLASVNPQLTPIDGQGRWWMPVAAKTNATAYLVPIDLQAELLQAPGGVIRVEAADLIARHSVPADGAPTTTADVVRPQAQADRTASDDEIAALRAALDEHYVALLSGEGSTATEALRWWPGAKTPTIGLRWGVGVYVAQVADQPKVTSGAELAQLTGPVGAQTIEGLATRITAGRFGAWPENDGPLRDVVRLGAGKQADLMERGRAAGLDAIAVFVITNERIGVTDRYRTSLKVRVIDLSGRQPVWSSEALNNQRIAAAGAGAKDLIDQFIATIFQHVDETMALAEMPKLSAEQARRRAASFAETPPASPLGALVELRAYHAQGLLTDAEAASGYSALGLRSATAFTTAETDKRREMLTAWLKEQRL